METQQVAGVFLVLLPEMGTRVLEQVHVTHARIIVSYLQYWWQ